MKQKLVALAICCVAAVAGGFWQLGEKAIMLSNDVTQLQEKLVSAKASLLGQTKYTDFISAGKSALAKQTKFVAANATRPYTVIRHVERSFFIGKSTGEVMITYSVDYAFGYDVTPESYDVVDTPSGLEIRIGKPMLMTRPAVHDLHYRILSGGWFVDEKAAVLHLYEDASKFAQADGAAMQSDEAIVALCEKSLIAFLHDFLAKQPGVGRVPAVTVSYSRDLVKAPGVATTLTGS